MLRGQSIGIGLGILTFAAYALPAFASAAPANVQTQVLIPQGSATCAALTVQSVTPYVYDNALNSFDVTVSDPSYVSVLGSAGNTGIQLNYMTRRMNPDGSLRIHIDLPTTPIDSSLPVTLTLLSAVSGQPVCISVISFAVLGNPAPSTPAANPVSSNTGATSGGGSVSSQGSTAASASPSSTTSSVTPATAPVVGGGLQSALSRACSAAGLYQLWFILLALYMVAVGLTAFAEPPLARRNAQLPAALILVPLVLLLGFWYLAPACRVATWIPFVLIVAAAIGLLTSYREKAQVASIINLPAAKPQSAATKSSFASTRQTQTTTIITPAKAQQTTTTITPDRVEQMKTIITPAPKKT